VFKKINEKIFVTEEDFVRSNVLWKSTLADLSFFDVIWLKNDIKKIIPEQYRHHFSIGKFEAGEPLGIHVDRGRRATINFYMSPPVYKTTCFKLSPNSNSIIKPDIHYHTTDVVETGSFVADIGDVYILDTTSLHSVKYIGGENDSRNRNIIFLNTFKFSFDQVVDMVDSTGYIL
jgi:hypothetical protein